MARGSSTLSRGMFGLFGKKKKYAELSEKARQLAKEHVREAKEERRKEQGLLYTFREREASNRRSGVERRRFHIEIDFLERRDGGERRVRLDRRGAMSAESEPSFAGRIKSRELMHEREHQLYREEEAINSIRRDLEKD